MEAAPGEDNVLGVGGYEKFGFVFGSSGSEEDADALEAWLPSSKLAGLRLDGMGVTLDPGRARNKINHLRYFFSKCQKSFLYS